MLHLLTKSPQEKGRLLEVLTADLLRHLGYLRIKRREVRSGEELDVEAVYCQPITNATVVELPVICEVKALSTTVEMPAWNTFKGKLFSARAANSRAIGLLISLSGFTAPVRDNYEALKRTAEAGSLHLLEADDVIAALVGLKKFCPPSAARDRIESVCPNRLASLDAVVLQLSGDLYSCFWLQHLFDDNGREAYTTVLQGDGTIPGRESTVLIHETFPGGLGRMVIPFDELDLRKITTSESKKRSIISLISQAPSQYVHALPAADDEDHISEILISFANTNDGKLIVGATREGIGGVADLERTLATISAAASFPNCRPEITLEATEVLQLDGRQVVVVDIRKHRLVHCTSDGRCLVRRSGGIAPNFQLFSEWSFESQAISVVKGAGEIADYLDERLVEAFRREVSQHKPGLANINESELLTRFGCLTEAPSGVRPTVAGIILLGKDPRKYCKSYGVQAVRFRGHEIPVDEELFADRLEIESALPSAVNETMAFLRRNTGFGSELQETERQESYDYPPEALREAVVNCLVHQDFSLNHKVRIYIFSDRIEFITPGGLPRGASLQKMRSNIPQHHPRNPTICDVMQYLDRSYEGLGSGIRRMAHAMKSAGLREPEFNDDGLEFKVILWGPAAVGELAAEIPTGTAMAARLEESRRSRVPLRERAISQTEEIAFAPDSPMLQILRYAEIVAKSDVPVLIEGETGTGKELLARHVHKASARRKGPFLAVNCAAIPEAIMESELFGHERGAFTGAVSARGGLFRAAHGGTLLLDEIADMPMSAQNKLLRVVELGEIQPVGSATTLRVDVRILSATNRDLRALVSQNTFRDDLYFRIGAFRITIPPLRGRRMDIPSIADLILGRKSEGKTFQEICDWEPSLYGAIMSYEFPGNVRELINVLNVFEIAMTSGEKDLVSKWWPFGKEEGHRREDLVLFDSAREAFERDYLTKLQKANPNLREATRVAGLSINRLKRLLSRYGMEERG